MKIRKFLFLSLLIILFGFVGRIYILHNNNLYFTVDQGRDATYVREILKSHTLFFKGPETSVRGIFTGPLWYYFISIGYAIFNGNPFGAAFMLILLNLVITVFLIWQIKKHVNSSLALIIGFGLQIFWPFFQSSLYGFNPFPLIALSIILIILLIKKYELALIPILLAFNTELAGAIVFLIFYILVGFYLVLYKKLSRKRFLLFGLTIPTLGLVKIIVDFLKHERSSINNGLQVFSNTNFSNITNEFIKIIGSIVPQQTTIGFLIAIVIVIIYLKNRSSSRYARGAKKFIYLSLILVIISYLFFGSNMGWREWHTVYIPSLTLITLLLMCYELKHKRILITIILVLNIINFINNYLYYLKPSNDNGLLYNQIKVLDWIYSHNEENGFNLYTYTHTFYDYNYQYLVSWYGKTQYGFYPCEYSNFPLSHKYLYIPGSEKYNEPKLGCDRFRFLIIESETNGNENKDWINKFRNETFFVEKVKIGNTVVEKRKTPDIY